MKILQENSKNIKEIVAALKNGAVLVLPTDTVYGLVCDASNEVATKKILKIKNREEFKSLLIFVGGVSEAKKFALINKSQKEFLEKNWPGAVTAILKSKKGLSPVVYRDGTVGLRSPNYEFLKIILKKFGGPLAQTSANVSGQPATNKIESVVKIFSDTEIQPDIIINGGDLPKNKPSTIIDLTNNSIKILR